MFQGEEGWLSLADAFYAAAVDGVAWDVAIEGLAAATGSRAGQLVGFGSDNAVFFNRVTGLGEEWSRDFLACGGADPKVNPILRAGLDIPPLKVLASAEFITPEERRASAYLSDFAVRHDTHHVCLTPLVKDNASLVGLAVIRSRRQGEINPQQRAVFASIAPHARAAVRMQIALAHQGAQIMAAALESLSLMVFICDRLGVVRAMTPAAEASVSRGDALQLKHGVLGTASRTETCALSEAIRVAAGGLRRPGAPLAGAIVVRGRDNKPVALDVLPLPRRESNFGFEPRVLVVVRGARPDAERIKGMLQIAYGLTTAEADVALRLSEGQPPDVIARGRGVAVGTVRAQIRFIYVKLDVNRQSELVSRINQLV